MCLCTAAITWSPRDRFWLDPTAPATTAHCLGELLLLTLGPWAELQGAATPVLAAGEAAGFGHTAVGKWLLLVAVTAVGFLGLALQTRGYQLEQAARASVMTVLEIPFAYVLQYALFHDELSLLGLLGVVVVCSATVLNLVRRPQLNDAATS